MNTTIIQDKECPNVSGWPILAVQVALGLGVGALMWGWEGWSMLALIGAGVFAILFLVVFGGYFIVQPNYSAVLMFMGEYKGTVKNNGLRFCNPLYSVSNVSQRTQNFESQKLKVNDLDGNPIEIAAVVVWRVENPASALLSVDNYNNFVKIQSEAAVRTLANHYAYDSHIADKPSLRDNPDQISQELSTHIQERLNEAGIKIIEARISHLAYAPEIAGAMLQRQQASAVVSARTQIVAGAVGMVQLALKELEKDNTVELDEERKAHMVSNLLVVLCSDRAAQPVINSGSLH